MSPSMAARTMMKRTWWAALLAACLAGGASGGEACPIPVFQYALEYWEADPYQVVVLRRGDLSAGEREALRLLEQATAGGKTPANLRLEVRSLPPDAGAGGARVEVRYPVISGIRRPVWSGELEVEAVRALLDSPKRREVARLLLERRSAVWVLLESGRRREDREAAALLAKELARLEKTLKVPDPRAWGMEVGEIDTRISFAVVRVRRDDPQERMLVAMLLNSEPDLRDFGDNVPMVFPIYGRGLIMHALVGRGINPWTIGDAGEFLTGPCSCQVKAANPGTDLLMSVAWETKVERRTNWSLQTPAGTGGFLERMSEAQRRLPD